MFEQVAVELFGVDRRRNGVWVGQVEGEGFEAGHAGEGAGCEIP